MEEVQRYWDWHWHLAKYKHTKMNGLSKVKNYKSKNFYLENMDKLRFKNGLLEY
jgi:hypothetical protein